MTVTCYRFSVDLSGSKIDPANRTIRQVSLISLGEAKGHDVFVDSKTLEQVYNKLTELGSLKVKADHGSGVLSTIGYVDQFEMGNDKVLGDLHVYEAEDEAPRIFEIARKNPHHLGMSLEFEGQDQKKDGKMFARCSDISAVALVSDPAANKSLFDKSNNFVDSSKKKDTNTSMVNKQFDEKDKANTGDTAPKSEDNGANDFAAFAKRFDDPEFSQKWSAFMKKYDEGAVNEADDKKEALPAINPNAEPKANNNGPTLSNDEKGSVKGEEPGANPPGAWEEDEKKMEKKIEMEVGRRIRQFASGLGLRNLPASGAPLETQKGDVTEKKFETLVEEKRKELEAAKDKDPKNNAIAYCMKNHTKAYAAWRPVQSNPQPRTL